jgi:triacylglycerol lipase
VARKKSSAPARLYHAVRGQLGSVRGVYLRSNAVVRRGDFAKYPETVLLLNGFFQTRTVWEVMENRLRHEGYGVLSFDLGGVLWRYQVRSITDQAGMIADKVESICERYGLDRFHIVGHSMGGLLARQYIQHRGGDRRVKSLITLGTPHHGTPTAVIGLGVTALGLMSGSAFQMLPRSQFLERLRHTPWPAHIPLASVYSRGDLVCPWWCSNLEPRPGEGAMVNRPVRGIGHTDLTHDPGVYKIVSTELKSAAALWQERTASQT